MHACGGANVNFIEFEGNGGVKMKGTRDWRYNNYSYIYSNMHKCNAILQSAKYENNHCISNPYTTIAFKFYTSLTFSERMFLYLVHVSSASIRCMFIVTKVFGA